MPGKRSLPPFAPTAPTLLEWAKRMHEFLTDTGSEAEVLPQSVLLRHQVANELYRAVTDGILMFDPESGHPVVSTQGQWIPLGFVNVLYHAELPAPLLITEAEGVVDVLTLDILDLAPGLYLATLTFVTRFLTQNDQISWQVVGDITTPIFLKEAKDDAEVIPFSFVVPVELPGGPFLTTLQVQVTGPGAADAIIEVAHIFLVRESDAS